MPEAPFYLVARPATPTPPADLAPATVQIGGGTISVRFTGEPAVSREAMIGWVEMAAGAVTKYYGKFPVKGVTVNVRAAPSGRIRNGTTYSGRLIRVDVGRAARQADLDDDWLLVHEMFHLAFPDVDRRHHWMEEGLCVYLEPLARARVGIMSDERYWRELVEGLPQGQPKDGDRGLDRTQTWARTYWGGCLFWFVADVEIRKQTGNRKSLDDATRAILADGGNGTVHWPLERILRVGDAATGTNVLTDLHGRMGAKAEQANLAELWKQLGVTYRDGRVTFDDEAPLAAVRKSVTTRSVD